MATERQMKTQFRLINQNKAVGIGWNSRSQPATMTRPATTTMLSAPHFALNSQMFASSLSMCRTKIPRQSIFNVFTIPAKRTGTNLMLLRVWNSSSTKWAGLGQFIIGKNVLKCLHNSPAARVLLQHCQLNPVNACYDALEFALLLLHLIIWLLLLFLFLAAFHTSLFRFTYSTTLFTTAIYDSTCLRLSYQRLCVLIVRNKIISTTNCSINEDNKKNYT